MKVDMKWYVVQFIIYFLLIGPLTLLGRFATLLPWLFILLFGVYVLYLYANYRMFKNLLPESILINFSVLMIVQIVIDIILLKF